MKSKKAFTLIELLVVIAIIGILATIAVISLYNTRAKARDAKRVADIKQVQTALELFFNDMDRYPTAAEFNSGTLASGDKTYMMNIPSAAMPADGTCDNTTNQFTYSVDSTGGKYYLSYCIGGKTGDLEGGSKCATQDGIYEGACDAVAHNALRLADIKTIEDALNAMESANGYYFMPPSSGTTYFNYVYGQSLYSGSLRKTNCSTVTSQPGDTSNSRYGVSTPCPTQSNWCIKLGADPGSWDGSGTSGTDCDSGTVYLRNIPLNNYITTGTWTTGWLPYQFTAINNFRGTDDYLRVEYRLEGSAKRSSDHFVNGVAADCRFDGDNFDDSNITCN